MGKKILKFYTLTPDLKPGIHYSNDDFFLAFFKIIAHTQFYD